MAKYQLFILSYSTCLLHIVLQTKCVFCVTLDNCLNVVYNKTKRHGSIIFFSTERTCNNLLYDSKGKDDLHSQRKKWQKTALPLC